MSTVITINVSGRRFEVTGDVLKRFPNSTLGRLAGKRDEIFYQRPIVMFKCVLAYHQTGHLHLPLSVCPGLAEKELEFWGFSLMDLDPCCARNMKVFFRYQNSMAEFEKDRKEYESGQDAIPGKLLVSPRTRVRQLVWNILDHPESSILAKVYFALASLAVIVSAATVILGPLPAFRGKMKMTDWKDYFGDEDYYEYHDYISQYYHSGYNGTYVDKRPIPQDAFVKNRAFVVISYCCAAFFTVELLFRLLACPSLVKYFKSVLNIVDILAVLAAFAEIALEYFRSAEKFRTTYIDIVNGLLILRMVRLFRLAKHMKGAQVLMFTFKTSIKEIGFMFLLLALASTVFGSSIFFINSDKILSIPDGIWWAVITMTTVGYGDVVPTNAVAKVIGILCACGGILIMALTVPLFVNNYVTFYANAAGESSLKKRSKKKSTVYPILPKPNKF